jgi:hypothetical protein
MHNTRSRSRINKQDNGDQSHWDILILAIAAVLVTIILAISLFTGTALNFPPSYFTYLYYIGAGAYTVIGGDVAWHLLKKP